MLSREWSATLIVIAVLAAGSLACSPEATRTRSGGPGADPGNHPLKGAVQMHGGQRPGQMYYQTPPVGQGVRAQQ